MLVRVRARVCLCVFKIQNAFSQMRFMLPALNILDCLVSQKKSKIIQFSYL